MKRTGLYKTVRAGTFLLLLTLAFFVWLAGTESGLRMTYRYAADYLPGTVQIEKLEGSLFGQITVSNLQYKQNNILIKASKLMIQWRPAALFTNKISVSKLHIRSLKIKLPTADKNKSNQPVTLPEINLPWRVAVKNVLINDISINQAEKDFVIKQIKLNATTVLNKLKIKQFDLSTNKFTVSFNGKINLSKTYQHKLDVQWRAHFSDKPAVIGKGQIRGDITATKIKQHMTGPVELSLSADVYNLLNNISWQAEANIIDISPTKDLPVWPSQLKGKILSSGQIKKGALIANINISDVNGKISGFPFSVRSQLNWHDAGLNINSFDLYSGKAQLKATGRIDTSLKVNLVLDSHNLSDFHSQTKGRIKAKAQLSGPLSNPVIKTTFNGKALSLPDYEIANINGEAEMDLLSGKKINAKINAQALNIKKYVIKTLNITADNHTIKAMAVSEAATALLEIKGEISKKGGVGRIEKAEIISSTFSDWKLKSAVNFNIGKQHFSLDPLCWLNTDGKLCVTVRHTNNIWHSNLEINKLPLNMFSLWLPTDLKPNGSVNATAEINIHQTNKLDGSAHVVFSPGVVSYPLRHNEQGHWKYAGGKIDITLNDAALRATSEISISKSEYFKAKLTLPKVNLLALNTNKQAIHASAQLNIVNLGLIEAIIPEVNNVKGTIGLNYNVIGTLAQPRYNGSIYLNNGTFRIPRLGVNIEQIKLKGQSNSLENLIFELSAQSGDGQITIKGNTLLNNQLGWPTSISIKGERFEVAHIPVSQLIVSPDLKIKLQNNKVDVSGQIYIPFAKLQPNDISTAARVSDDSVIIGDDVQAEKKWLINTKVRLILGDRVHFYGFGFEGRFAGNLLLQDEAGQLTKATGEITIPEGRYKAYGQRLAVEHGRLLFSGGPVTNPGLDIRAVRHISNVTAGLKVTGTLNYPKIELYSIPTMGQTDILSYMLLGRPIESAAGNDGEMMAKAALALSLVGGDTLARKIADRFGIDEMRVESSNDGEQASLVMGRYLSPKLYVGYGVGLIESFNTFNVRYQISDKWQLKGESGENHGADLLYTIER